MRARGAVELHDRALAGNNGSALAGNRHYCREGDAPHAIDADDDRIGVVRPGDVELRAQRIHVQRAVLGRRVQPDLVHAEVREAAEQPGCQRLTFRIDDLGIAGSKAGADRRDDAVFDEDVGAFQHARRSLRVNGRVADQDAGGIGAEGRAQARESEAEEVLALHGVTPAAAGCPRMKSDRGGVALARSYCTTPSIRTSSASAYTLKGSRFQTTTSAILPASSVPVRSRTPRARAALLVTHLMARSGGMSKPAFRPCAIALPASWFRR